MYDDTPSSYGQDSYKLHEQRLELVPQTHVGKLGESRIHKGCQENGTLMACSCQHAHLIKYKQAAVSGGMGMLGGGIM